jgi:hypothetical protein
MPKYASRRPKTETVSDEVDLAEPTETSNVLVLSATPEQVRSLLYNLKTSGAHFTTTPNGLEVIAFQSWGVTCDAKYDETAEQLTITVASKPVFLTYETISAGILESLDL